MSLTIMARHFFGLLLVDTPSAELPESVRLHAEEERTVNNVRIVGFGGPGENRLAITYAGTLSTAHSFLPCVMPRYDLKDEAEMKRAVLEYVRIYSLATKVDAEVTKEPAWLLVTCHG